MAHDRFRRLSESELYVLDDDATIQYAVKARDLGYQDDHDLAVDLMGYRHERRVKRRLRLAGIPPENLEDVTADVIARAIGASFDESTPGQFFSWLDTITHRAGVDFFRAPKSRTGLDEHELADEHDGEDKPLRPQGWEDFPDERVEAEDLVSQAMAQLDNALHREIIDLFVLRDLEAREVAERLGTSIDNVSQVKRRFKLLLRKLIEDGGP